MVERFLKLKKQDTVQVSDTVTMLTVQVSDTVSTSEWYCILKLW